MPKKMLHFSPKFATNAASRQTIDGVEHLVVPTVALMEGVYNGVFYPEDQIAVCAASWNGVPVPVGHPKPKITGTFASANTIEMEESVNVGRFYDAKFEDGKLKGNIYINLEKAANQGYGDIVEKLESGEMMEVSTAMLYDNNSDSGTHNGKNFKKTAKAIRPDHVALLVNEIGACSISGGCGASRNSDDGECCDDCAKKKTKIDHLSKTIGEAANEMAALTDEQGHGEIRQQIQLLLDKKSPEHKYPWIQEVFDSNFVYEFDGSLLQQHYIEKDGRVELVGESREVIREVDYTPVGGGTSSGSNVNKSEDDMDKTEKAALIAKIIGAENHWKDDDSGTLEALDDSVLKKMDPEMEDKAKKGDKKPKKGDEEKSDKKTDGATNALNDDERQTFNILKKREDDRVNDLRALVVAENENLTEEMVAAMATNAVEALASKIELPVDYSARNGAAGSQNKEQKEYVKPSVLLGANSLEQPQKEGAA